MSPDDTTRIHERLDQLILSMNTQAVALAKLSTSYEGLLGQIAESEDKRAATCPHIGCMSRIERKLDRMEETMLMLKWGGGIVTAALLIPGLHWFGAQLWALIT